MSRDPRRVGAAELFASVPHPFVQHQVHPDDVHGALVLGEAAVVDCNRRRVGPDPGAPTLWCVGPPADLAVLLAAAPDAFDRPVRLCVPEASYDAVPAAWRFEVRGHWHWMLTTLAPPAQPGEDAVVDVTDRGPAIDALLDRANPDSFARPGMPGVERWLGVPDGDALLAVGALYRDPDGTGHLRSVTSDPDHGGRGLGRAVSAALTRAAQTGASGTATLGVYVDNAPALAVYDRLGFRTAVTFLSGSPA